MIFEPLAQLTAQALLLFRTVLALVFLSSGWFHARRRSSSGTMGSGALVAATGGGTSCSTSPVSW